MGRTRSAVVSGTAEAIRLYGARKATMVHIAAAAGIAKGTLYNHVRTRSEAYRLLADVEVERLVELLKPSGDVAVVLRSAGDFVGTHPVVRALAENEPAALALVSSPGPLTDTGRLAVETALGGLVGETVAPLAFRWLISLLFDGGDAQSRAVEASMLAVAVDRSNQSFRTAQAG